jgi:hypothetical protein
MGRGKGRMRNEEGEIKRKTQGKRMESWEKRAGKQEGTAVVFCVRVLVPRNEEERVGGRNF